MIAVGFVVGKGVGGKVVVGFGKFFERDQDIFDVPHMLDLQPRAVVRALDRGFEQFIEIIFVAPTRRNAAVGKGGADARLDGDHAELTHTLNELIKNDFEKGRVAAALPVHRNTLRDRIARISELTGVDLESAEGRGLAWLAWLARVSA